MILAAIDVGTNSVKLQIARHEGGRFKVLDDRSTVTRLGRGLGRSGVIAPESAALTMEVLRSYLVSCRAEGARKVLAVGTEALRRAKNGAEFAEGFRREFGLPLKVITGEEEARLAFLGATWGREEDSLAALDIGGGSTELMIGAPGRLEAAKSARVGAVSMTEKHVAADPPAPRELRALRAEVRAALDKLPLRILEKAAQEPTLIGIGGTCANLGAMYAHRKGESRPALHGRRLSIDVVQRLADRLAALPLSARKRVEGLHPDRADIIVAGAYILLEVLDLLRMPTVTVSLHGIRRGLLVEAARL